MATIPSLMAPPATPDPTNLFAPGGAPVGYQMGANFLENQQREAFNNQALDLIRQGNIGTLANTREEIAREGRGNVLDLFKSAPFGANTLNYADVVGGFTGLDKLGMGNNVPQSIADRLEHLGKPIADITNKIYGTVPELADAGFYQQGQPLEGFNEWLAGVTGIDAGPGQKVFDTGQREATGSPTGKLVWYDPRTGTRHERSTDAAGVGRPPSGAAAVAFGGAPEAGAEVDAVPQNAKQEAGVAEVSNRLIQQGFSRGPSRMLDNGIMILSFIPAGGSENDAVMVAVSLEGKMLRREGEE
jgi:hypothetical protein